jgi:hypothetical protein
MTKPPLHIVAGSMFAKRPEGQLSPRAVPAPPRRKGKYFGRVEPLAWHQVARQTLRGMEVGALALADIIQFEWNMDGEGRPVRLTNRLLEGWDISRKVKYLTLRRLEAAGLIRVKRFATRSPTVVVVWPPIPLRPPHHSIS